MLTAQQLLADLETHYIRDIALEGNIGFACPLITPIHDNLWQGGCINGVSLQGYFKHVVSLYPWERFNPDADLDSFVEVRLYDGKEVPDEQQLYTLARWINLCKAKGRTLVHCQAGLNRSGLLTGLSLVLDGMAAPDAITLIRKSRSQAVLCNKAFEQWLLRQPGMAP